MTAASNPNKRIAKNTVMLYIRMLLTMIVSLYTSRIVLNTLGVEDFGIYSVVGGFVFMFGFMNNAMTSATQRFLSFELGKSDVRGVNNVFNMSLNIHYGIALLVLLVTETIGLWFVRTKLNVPPDRLLAAIWVYQFSIFSLVVNIISVPYTSMLIAYEKMSAYAGISIIEVSLKLLIVFMLQWFGYDKLKFYAVLSFLVVLIIRFCYGVYCKLNFKEVKFQLYWNTSLFKQISNHVGWMLFGTSAQMLSTQGVNMLMNVFFGVTVNAARGIAFQVRGAVHSFVVNFMIAVRPQIIKTYAQGELEKMNNLIFTASKFSFFLLFYLSLPFLLLTNTILTWWLKIVPDHSVLFTRLVIVDLFFVVIFTSLNTLSQASGKIRLYQLALSGGLLLIFLFSYVFFKLGFPSYYAFIITIAVSLISLFVRLLILKKLESFPMAEFLNKVFLKSITVVVLSIPLPLIFLFIVKNLLLQFLTVSIASVISTSIIIWFVGLTKKERYFLKQKIHEMLNKFHLNR